MKIDSKDALRYFSYKFERELNGRLVLLAAEISPCCWMYNHPLQVEIRFREHGGSCFFNSSKPYDEASIDDAIKLAERTKIMPCKRCGSPAFKPRRNADPKYKDRSNTNRGGLCEKCFIDDWDKTTDKLQRLFDLETDRRDLKQKKQGYKYRITAWIHAGGDDQMMDFYTKTEPSKREIEALLRKHRSKVLNDYTVTEL